MRTAVKNFRIGTTRQVIQNFYDNHDFKHSLRKYNYYHDKYGNLLILKKCTHIELSPDYTLKFLSL